MISQKEISYQVISQLRNEGKSDDQILLLGPPILLERWKNGEWTKSKGSSDDQSILFYSKNLLKNWMMKDTRLTGGIEYTPKNPRGPRNPRTWIKDEDGNFIQEIPENEVPKRETNLRGMLEYIREKDPTNEVLIQDLEERIMWEEMKKVG